MHPCRTRSTVRSPPAPPVPAARAAAPTNASRPVDSTDRVSRECRSRRCYRALTLATALSVTLNNALTARGLEAAAKLVGLIGRRERPRHGAVINPFGAKIGASNDGVSVSEFAGELLLKRAQGRQRVDFAPLRRHLHEISPGRSFRRDCGRRHRGHPWRGRREGTLRRG